MEGTGVRAPFTSVIMGVLIFGLVVAQIEAFKVCCVKPYGILDHKGCMGTRTDAKSAAVCSSVSGCIIRGDRDICPPLFPLPADNMHEKSVIEEVTTDVKAALFGVICPEAVSVICFSMCHDTQQACAKHCGCIIQSPHGI